MIVPTAGDCHLYSLKLQPHTPIPSPFFSPGHFNHLLTRFLGDCDPSKLPPLHLSPQPSIKQFLMSSRTTRSSARLATDPPPADADSGSTSTHAAGSAPSRKRKASGRRDRHPDAQNQPPAPSSPRRSKRQKTTASHPAVPAGPAASVSRRSTATRGRAAMSQPG